MEYLLKASGIVIILLAFYLLFLKDETFFKSIRTYFIFGLVSTLLVPLIEIPIYIETAISTFNYNNFDMVTNSLQSPETINWSQFFVSLYLIGVVFFSLKFLTQLISLAILILKHPIIKKEGHYFIETSKNLSPFSFFKIIVYNKSQFSIKELTQIINHEKAHANQWHSIDTLLAHLLVILLWFNPFVWLFKKVVQQNLEFLADAYAIEKTESEKHYQLTLLKTYSAVYCTETTNNFYNSLIKKRIVMLHKNRSKNKSQWKYALLLPLLASFVFTFNTKTIAQEKHTSETDQMKLELILDKNSTNAELEKLEKEGLKKEFGLKLSFKGIKRNSDNEITAIKINAKGKNTSASFENSGTHAILPIKIVFDSYNNSITIGNLNTKHNKYIYKVDGDKKERKNVWIHKDSDGKHKTKVISEKHTIHFEADDNEEHEMEIIIDSDNDENNNVFVIKTDGDKIKKHKITKKGNFVFVSSDDKKPIYFLNGKEISSEEMDKIDQDSIKTMMVLNGTDAIEEYGKKAKDGVILITTKKE